MCIYSSEMKGLTYLLKSPAVSRQPSELRQRGADDVRGCLCIRTPALSFVSFVSFRCASFLPFVSLRVLAHCVSDDGGCRRRSRSWPLLVSVLRSSFRVYRPPCSPLVIIPFVSIFVFVPLFVCMSLSVRSPSLLPSPFSMLPRFLAPHSFLFYSHAHAHRRYIRTSVSTFPWPRWHSHSRPWVSALRPAFPVLCSPFVFASASHTPSVLPHSLNLPASRFRSAFPRSTSLFASRFVYYACTSSVLAFPISSFSPFARAFVPSHVSRTLGLSFPHSPLPRIPVLPRASCMR